MTPYLPPTLRASTPAGQIRELYLCLRELVDRLNRETPASQVPPAAEPPAPGPLRGYPVGSLYASLRPASPQTLLGGLWRRLPEVNLEGETLYLWTRTQ